MTTRVPVWDRQGEFLCTVASDVNIKKSFGAHAFLIDKASHALVEFADSGAASAPLSSSSGYVLLSALSHSLVEGRRVRGCAPSRCVYMWIGTWCSGSLRFDDLLTSCRLHAGAGRENVGRRRAHQKAVQKMRP